MLEGIYEAKDGAPRVMPLEGVRGLAVTLVFLFHFHEAFGLYLPAQSSLLMLSAYAARLGYYGVDLFFTLSGFLIYGALMRSRRSYLGFIGRRIQRIYPTFVVVFCIYLVLSAVFPERSRLPSEGRWTYVLQNLLLLPGVWGIKPVVGVAWSLSYEMVFYVTLPLVMAGLAFRAWRPGARIALALAVALVVLVTGPPDSALGQFLMFVPGIILYELLYSLRSPLWLSLTGERIALGAFLATFPAAILLESMRVPLDVAGALPCWRAVLRMLVVGGGFLLMLLYAVAGSGPVGRLFRWTPLRWLGNVSYSYYLIHGLALNGVAVVVLGLAPPSSPRVPLFLLLLPLAYALTIVMATGLFVLIERPLSMRTRNS
jgi:peptidoglycan/LPS O-acetylase OafA/YrhL